MQSSTYLGTLEGVSTTRPVGVKSAVGEAEGNEVTLGTAEDPWG